MHILQPKHIRLTEEEATALFTKYNVSKAQLPKILSTDPALPEGCQVGDVIRLERKNDDGTVSEYFRVVV